MPSRNKSSTSRVIIFVHHTGEFRLDITENGTLRMLVPLTLNVTDLIEFFCFAVECLTDHPVSGLVYCCPREANGAGEPFYGTFVVGGGVVGGAAFTDDTAGGTAKDD